MPRSTYSERLRGERRPRSCDWDSTTCMAPGKQAELEQSASPQEHHKDTVVRLARIQSHLATAPRTGKLKGKVAIITGVSSLKGIGYTVTSSNVSAFVILTCSVGEHLHYPLLMKVGRLLRVVEQRHNVSKSRRRATSLPHGLVRGEPYQFEVDHRGAVSRRDSADIAFVPSHGVMVLTSSQVTFIQADASDDKAISDVCQQAFREQGRLDIFFANVSARRSTLSRHVKGFLCSGWGRILAHVGRDIR